MDENGKQCYVARVVITNIRCVCAHMLMISKWLRHPRTTYDEKVESSCCSLGPVITCYEVQFEVVAHALVW